MIKSLIHKGPVLPNEYEYQNLIKGLSPLAEEMLVNYVNKLDDDLKIRINISNINLFNTNFYNCLKYELSSKFVNLKFPEDYKNIFQIIKENYTKPKTKNDYEEYSYAYINSNKEKILNYMIEPPGIFIGRGECKYNGMWKYRVGSDNIIVNFIKGDNNTKLEELYFQEVQSKFKNIISNPTVTYIDRYFINLGKSENENKYLYRIAKEIRFSKDSTISHEADLNKFDKANKLIKNWNKINNYILENINNEDKIISECAVISWLVQYTSIRIGSDKSLETNVVGASSLRTFNLDTETEGDKYFLILDFIGKDSIKYNQKFEIPMIIHSKIKDILKTKSKDDFVFSVNSTQVNQFLDKCIPGITAKVFRTAWACKLLLELYDKNKSKFEDKSVKYKILLLKYLLIQISNKLNHKKATKKNNDTKINNLEKKIKDCNDKDKKELYKLKINILKDSEDTNTSTALTSYIDPRIVIDICKEQNIPIDKIYTKTLLRYFNYLIN